MNWPLFLNSLLVATMAMLLAVGFGLVAALWLATLEVRLRNVFLALAIVALALPPFLITNCWISLLGESGSLRVWLPFKIYSLGGTIWILALMLWPITTLAVLAAWRRLEAAQFECEPAMTGLALLRWLLIPVGRGEIALAAVLTFVLALNNFAVPAILQTKVLPDEMWVQFNTKFDTEAALRSSIPLLIAPVLLLAWASRRGVSWPRVQGAVSAQVFRRQLGTGWRFSSGFIALSLVVLSVGFPLAQIGLASRTWAELPGAIEASTGAIWHSFWFAALGATMVVGTSVLLRCHRRGQLRGLTSVTTTILWLPFFIPGVLLGIALIKIFNRPILVAFYQSVGIVLLALALRYFALAWTAARHAVAAIDSDLTDAARLEGASRWQMLRFVTAPQIAPQLFAAWYVVYLLCLWDVESIVIIQPPGGETLALKIFNLLHYGYAAQVNALCLTLLGLAVLPLVVWWITKGLLGKASNRQSLTPNIEASPRKRTSALLIAQIFNLLDRRIAFGRARKFSHRLTPSTPRGFQIGDTAACNSALPAGAWSRIFLGVLLLIAVGFCSGCSPASASHEIFLRSQLFENAIVIGSRGVGVGEFNKPRSVAVDLQDNVYAVDMTGRVQKYSPEGVFLLSWQMPQTDLGKPKGMGRDRQGNIIVVEPHYQRVNHFTPEGKLVAQWGCRGTNEGCFMLPRGIGENSHGEYFISEYMGAERVQCFKLPINSLSPQADSLKVSVAPDLLKIIGQAGIAPGEFNRAEGVCVDAQDRVYVADSCNHRIQIFSRDGKFLRTYGKPGSGLGELSYPYDIAVDARGYQFVCEFGNSRIQVFDANCQPVETIGGPGASAGQFNNPWGVALDSHGNLYVADALNHRLQKLVRRQSIASQPSSVAKNYLTAQAADHRPLTTN